jgi:transcriptional regulator with XRE-family HTH domain
MHLQVGPALRRARESRKLSLRDVAAAIGVSASMLSQVETGKIHSSVSTLYDLVNYLGISLDGVLGTNAPTAPPADLASVCYVSDRSVTRLSDNVVQRREDDPVIQMEDGATWQRMAVGGTSVADPMIVTYSPTATSSAEGKMMRHAGVEYGVLLEGQLTLLVDFGTYELEPGDSFCVDSGRPHLYVNRSDRIARGIWFVVGRREMQYRSLADLGHDYPGRVHS